MRIPDELSVIVFDDNPWTELTSPPLSVIRQPIDMLAVHSLELVLGRMQGRLPPAPRTIEVKADFVPRSSCSTPLALPHQLRKSHDRHCYRRFHTQRRGLNQVAAALSPAIAEVHEEPGCLLYAIHEAPNGQIVMIEKWETAELLDAHGAGEPVKRLNASLDGLLQGPVEVTRHEPILAGTPDRGRL